MKTVAAKSLCVFGDYSKEWIPIRPIKIRQDKEVYEVESLYSGARCVEKRTINFSEAEKEVFCLQKLKHKNIVRYYGHGKRYIGNKQYACVLVECGQVSLYEMVNKGYRFTPTMITSYMVDVVNALICCHKNSILHFDVALRNIVLFNNFKKVKLIDFGNSQLMIGGKALIGQNGLYPSYFPPESYFCNKWLGELAKNKFLSYTPKSDVWSLGCSLYELISDFNILFSLDRNKAIHEIPHKVLMHKTRNIKPNMWKYATRPSAFTHKIIDIKGMDRNLIYALNCMLIFDHNKRIDCESLLKLLSF